ncbi:salicylate hydroxylase [Rhizodiscina lignyota]|uniref:Salicylate hydroxylase n=1 Tax=Rhizodiscina lignyota TaxID=1504668 RepID=A0A9P4MBG4_9PEZI|nr:salicylate hydroxylase [Rhizodiscina lignyota]
MVQVVIIGGGFAGPVLALSLKKHKISSAIYEVRSKDWEHGGNIALAPNALRVMDSIGLYDEIRSSGFNYQELAFTSGNGHTLGKFLNGSIKEYHYPALRIHRTIVREALRKKVEEVGIPMYYEKKCTKVVGEDDNSATVEFADGEKVTADFVVGADGIHSHVRQFIHPCEPEFSGLMGIMAQVDASELRDIDHGLQLPAMLFGEKGSFAIMPSSFDGKEIGYFATIEQQDRGRDGWAKLETDKDEMAQLLADRFTYNGSTWPEMVRALCEKTPKDTLTSWPFYSVPHMEKFSSPKARVIVIGDSAHAIPPTGGQGAAMALEDASTLAYTLAHSYFPDFQRQYLPQLLEAWEKHRMPRLHQVVDFTTKNGNLRKSSPHYLEQAAKEWVLWTALKMSGETGGAQWMYSYSAEDVKKNIGETGLKTVTTWT